MAHSLREKEEGSTSKRKTLEDIGESVHFVADVIRKMKQFMAVSTIIIGVFLWAV